MRTTRWSLVQRAARGGSADLDEWARASWYPLYTWARQKDWSPEDAAHALQDFLGKICNNDFLQQVAPALGRLHSWLLAGFSNHLSSRRTQALRFKRGGGMKHVPVDRQSLESFYQTDMAAVRFRQRYRRLLLDVAAERLGITCKARQPVESTTPHFIRSSFDSRTRVVPAAGRA